MLDGFVGNHYSMCSGRKNILSALIYFVTTTRCAQHFTSCEAWLRSSKDAIRRSSPLPSHVNTLYIVATPPKNLSYACHDALL